MVARSFLDGNLLAWYIGGGGGGGCAATPSILISGARESGGGSFGGGSAGGGGVDAVVVAAPPTGISALIPCGAPVAVDTLNFIAVNGRYTVVTEPSVNSTDAYRRFAAVTVPEKVPLGQVTRTESPFLNGFSLTIACTMSGASPVELKV